MHCGLGPLDICTTTCGQTSRRYLDIQVQADKKKSRLERNLWESLAYRLYLKPQSHITLSIQKYRQKTWNQNLGNSNIENEDFCKGD